MGTWGPGNFDSDTAADHLSVLADKLVTDIETAMSGEPTGLEPDEWDGTTVPCNVELLTLLAKQRWVGVTLPAPATVAAWGTRFVEVWDGSIDGLTPKPEWKLARREVLVRTFAELEELCAREAASQAVPFAGAKSASKSAPKSASKSAPKVGAKSSKSASKADAKSASKAVSKAGAKSAPKAGAKPAPKAGAK